MLQNQKGTPITNKTELPEYCFHCQEIIPDNVVISAKINGKEQYMCCHGCKAVAEAIQAYGLQKFYEYRTDAPSKPDKNSKDIAEELALYDEHSIQEKFIEIDNEKYYSASLLLENIVCAACCWLIETQLSRLDGVIDVAVNYSNNRARIRWDSSRTSLGRILKEIATLGYRAYPYNPQQEQNLMERERKDQLRRIALAGLLGMQVMMIAVALYVGDWSGNDAVYRNFFYWISLGLTLPVVIYSAAPFFKRAWRDVKLLKPGMDVPVALGIGIAFSASCWATVTGRGDVYFDSVVMFVFLLSLGRYLEFMARKKAVEYIESLGRLLPVFATRLTFLNGHLNEEKIPVAKLIKNDRILVRPGETVPIDGTITEGITTIDESILTGESFPLKKEQGSTVFGGSTNIDSPIQIEVGNTGKATLIAHIQTLIEQGRDIKPEFIALADKIAGWFILFILMSAGVTGCYWYYTDASVWLPVTVSVLIITCPCALSLAMPTALASASSALMKRGVAVVHLDAIETLAKSTWFIFDKTGTLTEGKLKLRKITSCSPDIDEQTCLDIASALEIQSEHPIAKALRQTTTSAPQWHAGNIRNYPGEGITGSINNTIYYLGNENFIRKNVPAEKLTQTYNSNKTTVYLADKNNMLAVLFFSDDIRNEAEAFILDIQRCKLKTGILSGDNESMVKDIAGQLNILHSWSKQSPDDKVERITGLQQAGEVVAMAGDGINDAPVLATADVSIAMGSGTDLTRASADIILLNNNLLSLSDTLIHARKTMKIIKQNLVWAFFYNLIALPVAATGFIVPWMAALGMSMSSLFVIMNSLRLTRIK